MIPAYPDPTPRPTLTPATSPELLDALSDQGHGCEVTDCGRRCGECDERMTCMGPTPRPCGDICRDCPCSCYECKPFDADRAQDHADEVAFEAGRERRAS